MKAIFDIEFSLNFHRIGNQLKYAFSKKQETNCNAANRILCNILLEIMKSVSAEESPPVLVWKFNALKRAKRRYNVSRIVAETYVCERISNICTRIYEI